MNDAEYAEQKARFEQVATKWKAPCGFTHWDFVYAYHRDHWQGEGISEGMRLMDVSPSPEYLEAGFNVYLPALQEVDDDKLEVIYIHELGHLMVAGFAPDGYSKTEELACTMIAHAVDNAYRMGIAEGARLLDSGSRPSLDSSGSSEAGSVSACCST